MICELFELKPTDSRPWGFEKRFMQLAAVIGHATSTVKHPTLVGLRMLIVQPLDAQQGPDGPPIIAIDSLGGSRGDRVMISSDGKAARELVGAQNSPIRWVTIGLIDEIGT
jgi:ethanolamine utilization protein EutN